MHPEDTLTTLAELGIAVTGFSGIVVALGARARDGVAGLTTVVLYGGVGVVLWALVPLIMLSAQLPEHTVWIVASAGWSAQQVLVLIMRAYRQHTLPQGARTNTVFFALSMVGGVSILALQIVNVVWLASAWPHLTSLAWWLMLALMVFLSLMRASHGEG